MTPPMTAPHRIDRITHKSRMGVASTPKVLGQSATDAGDLRVGRRSGKAVSVRIRRSVSGLGNDEPGRDVGEHTADDGARDDRKHHPRRPDQDDVDVEVVGNAGTHAGNLSLGP